MKNKNGFSFKLPRYIPRYLPALFFFGIVFFGFIKTFILAALILLAYNKKEIMDIYSKRTATSSGNTDAEEGQDTDTRDGLVAKTLHKQNLKSQGGSKMINNKLGEKISNLNIDKSQVLGHFHLGKKALTSALLIIGAIILFNLCTFTVDESTTVVVKTLGNMNKIIVSKDNTAVDVQNTLKPDFKNLVIVKDKGLFFKIPFIQSVNSYTSKLITYQSTEELVTTGDKRQYMVEFFAQYKVTHPGLFEVSMADFSKANSTLDNLIYPVIIKKINKLPSEEFLTNKEKLYSELEESKRELNEKIAHYGIEVDDIEIHRTLLPPANIASTYDKMVKERQAIAQQMRSEGDEEYDKVVSATDREKKELIGAAIEESESIKGEADSQALKIYSEAFSKDPGFYEFLRTLKAYESSIDSETTIYLDKNNEMLRIFSNGN